MSTVCFFVWHNCLTAYWLWLLCCAGHVYSLFLCMTQLSNCLLTVAIVLCRPCLQFVFMAELTAYRLWSLCCAGHVYINVELKPDKDKKGKVGFFFFFSTLLWRLCQPWLLVLLFQLLREGMSTLASVMCIHTTVVCICATILCIYTTVVGVCSTVICSDTTVVCVDTKPTVLCIYTT